jgi:hypothetical protein
MLPVSRSTVDAFMPRSEAERHAMTGHGTCGAGGAYAAAVPRVTVTLEPIVRALLRFRFRIFSPTRGHPLHCQPLVRAASAAPSPSFSGTHPRRISGATPTLRLLKCPRPRPSSPPNQAASAARRRPRSMFNTSLSDILVCARTWRSPGGTGGSRRLTHGPIRWSALIRGDRGAGHSGKARTEVSATIRPAKRAGSSCLAFSS